MAKEYSEKTKRHCTPYAGVYQREAERVHGEKDICYDITYKAEGKKVWEKVGWKAHGYTAKLAAKVRAKRILEIQHGEDLPQKKPKAPLFSEVAEKYLEWAKANKVQAGLHDKSRYENHLKPLDSKRLDEISPFDLESMKIQFAKKGLAPASVKHCLVLVRMMINKAIAWNLWDGENPVRHVKLPTLQNERQRFLTYQEASTLLKRLKEVSPFVHDMALVSLHCGLRFGEIAGLRGVDLDFENGTLHISDPKNKSARTAYMTEAVKVVLRGRIQEKPEAYVFPDKRHGGKIASVSQTYPKIVQELKFNDGITDTRQKVTFHTLRHTHASWLALAGESLLTIREALGHKDLQMVKRYAHLSADSRKQAALRLEETFDSNKEIKPNGPTKADHRKET